MHSNHINYYSVDDTRLIFIDGNICDTLEKGYITLAQQLSIPDYFGYNLDAFEEILSDLEWIEETYIRVIVINLEKLLWNDIDHKREFLDILMHCGNERVSVIGV